MSHPSAKGHEPEFKNGAKLMHPDVREALEDSIKHWEENVAAQFPSQAHVWADHCALCNLFNDRIWRTGEEEDCVHETYGPCPVYARTGEDQCGGSPWEKAQLSQGKWNIGVIPKEQWQEAAQAELDFLRSLRED